MNEVVKYRYLLGIDGDVHKSGVCLLDRKEKSILLLTTMTFPKLLDYFLELKEKHGKELRVSIEAGWLNKSNWHRISSKSSNYNAKIGERTGANFEVGKKLFEMCEHYGIDAILVKPTRKKLDKFEFFWHTGYNKRNNQEERDSCMLVYGY